MFNVFFQEINKAVKDYLKKKRKLYVHNFLYFYNINKFKTWKNFMIKVLLKYYSEHTTF